MLVSPQGLIILVVSAGIAGLVHLVYPFLHLPHRLFGIGIILVVTGMIADAVRQHARLFFIPVWVLGWLVMSAGAWQRWGWLVGLGSLLALFVLAFLLAGIVFAAEKKHWEQAQAAFQLARETFEMGDIDATWGHLQRSLSLPSVMPMDSAMYEHHRQLARFLAEVIGEIPPALQLHFKKLDDVFAHAQAGERIQNPVEAQQLLQLLQHLLATKGDLHSLGIVTSTAAEDKQALVQQLLANKKSSLPPPPPDQIL
ncbi:MAG: hypothetical protein H6728_06115 [Myxococcales bacterium]|nr:hypothetical protein [Myxococcales bacterium]